MNEQQSPTQKELETIKAFEAFWAQYEGTFPGYARGEAIQSLCREIALRAWKQSQSQAAGFAETSKVSFQTKRGP